MLYGGEEVSQISSSRLVVLQKHVICFISNSYFLAHTSPLFIQLQLRKLDDVHTFQLVVFMYRTKHDLLPPTCSYAIVNTSSGPYNLRKRRDFQSTPFRTLIRKKHITHAGPYAWEALPDYLKQSDSLQILKSRLYLYFINRYNKLA